MKKLFSMIIVLGMLYTVVGCGSKEKGTTADNVVDFTSCKVSLVKDSFNYDGKEKSFTYRDLITGDVKIKYL